MFGGHEFASGLTIKTEYISLFKDYLNIFVKKKINTEDLIHKIKIDGIINKEDINIENIKGLYKLEPYGAGNLAPVFIYRNLLIKEIKTVGDDKHIKIFFGDKDLFINAIGFNMGLICEELKCGDIVDIVSMIEINRWNKIEKIQLNLKDIKISM